MANHLCSIQETCSGPSRGPVPINIGSVAGTSNNTIVYKFGAAPINSQQPNDEHGFWYFLTCASFLVLPPLLPRYLPTPTSK